MGTADIVTKEYMRENTVFADAFNYLIYNGKKVIDPAKLIEIDSTEIVLPFGNEEKVGEDKKWEVQKTEWSSVKNGSVRKKNASRVDIKSDAVQRYRDILKSAVVKQDEKMSYVLLGIENQTVKTPAFVMRRSFSGYMEKLDTDFLYNTYKYH